MNKKRIPITTHRKRLEVFCCECGRGILKNVVNESEAVKCVKCKQNENQLILNFGF